MEIIHKKFSSLFFFLFFFCSWGWPVHCSRDTGTLGGQVLLCEELHHTHPLCWKSSNLGFPSEPEDSEQQQFTPCYWAGVNPS